MTNVTVLYRDLIDGEIIQKGDRILTAEAGFQPVKSCIGNHYRSANGLVIQRPVSIEGTDPRAIATDVDPNKNVEWTMHYNPPYGSPQRLDASSSPQPAPARPDTEIVAQIIRSIDWSSVKPNESADMLKLLMEKKTIGDVSEIIERNTNAVSLLQADSYRAAFNTDCLLKIVSNLVTELREKEKINSGKRWYQFWRKS